jgi:hypothetical protein
MLGAMQGSHVTERGGRESSYRGERLHNPERDFQPVKFGNELALNVGKGGCGTGRTVYATGSQGTQGNVAAGNPPPNSQRDPLENE